MKIHRTRIAKMVAIALLGGIPAIDRAQPVVEQRSLQTNGHPFVALPVDGGVLVSVTANGRPGSVTGVRVFAGPTSVGSALGCINRLPAPAAMGMATAPGSRAVAVASGDTGLVLLDRAALLAGCGSRAIVIPMGARAGTFDVAISHDGRFAFVANEYGVAGRDATGRPIPGYVAVVALTYDGRGAPTGGTIVNRIVTGGTAVTGVTFSPDERRLYVTSEIARAGARAANTDVPILAHDNCRQGNGPAQPFGLLSVVDVGRAVSGGPNTIIAATAAGCAPVRAAVAPGTQTLWVAARGDDRVLSFSAAALENDPGHALLGAGPSGGNAPVGIALFAGGRRLAVANSNRFGGPQATGRLAIVAADPAAPKVVRTIPATFFPRSVTAAGDDRTLLLTDYDGGQVQIIAPAEMP